MSANQQSGNIIADRYATALYDITIKENLIEAVLNDLKIIEEYITSNKDLKLLVRSPLVASNDKLKIFNKILKDHSANNLTKNFVKIICVNKRISNIVSIISRFKSINAEKRGDILADVTSAEDLSQDQKDGIKQSLRKILGDKLSLNFFVDKKIIGGLIVKVGSKMIDSSISSKINKLKIAMRGA